MSFQGEMYAKNQSQQKKESGGRCRDSFSAIFSYLCTPIFLIDMNKFIHLNLIIT
ncbi:hypothetical protein TFKS16_1987 [Tannerella forsythia KS16]|uniref:Uncharacterized protein n=1 Tax=Tannerella forsythia (strain ATCC 43037 / JCM 10827 / CCUG 21028 A / KCTC 5666 / FDC 338) TaxID=203275 RepID=G8UJ97_TANFA|nr:hypothetical protein BFO_2223 [Tannerella forsythia 92A2]BAR49497.1 hypothetical protein TF3313_2031 [Tannerella forsythia 3313]BAR52202.1 hypothetical protein TFKS16_1987 [Tannerella forsythia KS16]